MDRNAEICQHVIDYAFSVYLRQEETKDQFIKVYGDQIKAIQFLRKRGLQSQQPEATIHPKPTNQKPTTKAKKPPVKSKQESLF